MPSVGRKGGRTQWLLSWALRIEYISILPSTSKLAPELYKSMNKTVPKVGSQAGQTMGSRMASAAGKALKAGAVVGVAAVGAAVGTALVGGFKNAVSRQNSQKVLTGLYGSAKDATAVMKDLRDVSSKSPLDYTSYVKAAESLAYAGVEGKDATGTLKNVGKAIVAAGGDSTKLDQAMGGVMKAVNNGGIAMMDSLSMISESGVPILSGLSEKFGKPIDQIKKMASEGKINITDVMDVMQNGTGETFQKMMKAGDAASQSFGNQWKIAKDNIVNAVGDNLLPLLEKLAPMIKPIGDAIVAGIGKIPGIVDQAIPVVKQIVAVFKEWWPVLATLVGGFAAYKLVMLGVTIGTAAYNVVLKAQKIAALGSAGAIRVMNAALRANPIGLIITAITLLVAAFIVMYKKVDWFRNGVNAAWAGIKIAVKAVSDWFTGVLVPFFQAAITSLVVGFQVFQMRTRYYWALFKQVLSVVWNWVKTYVFTPIANFVTKTIPNAFKLFVGLIRIYIATWRLILTTAWKYVKTYVFNPIKNFVTKTIPNAFQSFVNLIRQKMDSWKRVLNLAWSWVRLHVFRPINVFVKETIPSAFQAFVNLIRSRMDSWKNIIRNAWVWVKEHAFNPITKFVKETIPNAFKRGVDLVGEFWNKLKKTASKPVKFVVDTVYNNGLRKMWNPIADFIGKKNWKLKEVDVSKFATGGRVSGPGTSTSDSIPARLSNNEHVLTAKDVRNLGGHSNVYALRRAAATGWTPGLATGGTLIDAANWWVRKGARGSRHPAFGGAVRSGHSRNSLHYQDRAVDLNYGRGGAHAAETNFFNRHLAEFKSLYKGIRVIWQSKGHYDHMHIDNSKGADIGNFNGASGGGGGWIPGLDKLVSWVKDKVKGVGGEGRVAEGMQSMVGKLIDGVAEKARSVFDVFGGGGGSTTVPDEGVAKAVQNVAANYGWDEGQQWQSLRWLIDKESSWNPNAANPTSSARGLFQKMTSIHGPLESTVEGQARWGLNYIKNRYGDPISAQRWHRSHNWYAKGTLAAARGWATVGENGPELLKLRGGEQIKSNRSARRFVRENGGGEGMVIQLTTPTVERNEVDEWVDKTKFAFTHLAKTSAFSGVNG